MVTALILVIDQFSKYIIVSNFELYDSWMPVPAIAKWFEIRYVTNTGAVFGLFQSGGTVFMVISVLVSLVILFYYFHLPDGKWLMRFGMGMQLGGALGNLIDRFRLGHVIDFLDMHYWPVFNVADSMIVCGVILLALVLLYEDWRERKSARIPDKAKESI